MKRFVWLGTVVFVLLLLWSAGWFAASWYVRDTVLSLAEADGVDTPRLVCQTLDIGGFPLGLDVRCNSGTLTQADLTATLPQLRATAVVYQPTQIQAFAQPPLTLTDAFTGSSSEVGFADLSLSASLQGLRIGSVSLVANGLDWTNTAIGRERLASAEHMEVHLLDIPEQHDPATGRAALAGYVTAGGIVAPSLQIAAGTAEVEAEFNGLPDDVRLYLEQDILQRWQAAGGQVRLISFNGQDGESSVSGDGTLALDAAARLEGQVRVTSTGLAERAQGLIPAPLHGLIMGQQAADGTYHQTVAARSGVMFAGMIPIGTVPPLF